MERRARAWVGALTADRVMGEQVRRIERDRALPAAARASVAASLSDALVEPG